VHGPLISPTPHQLRALTHPVRLRMLGMLRHDGPATASGLAQRLGLNTGATSYHLRQLATHGFIVDDEGRGTGRERWWRAAHARTYTESPPASDVEGRDTYDAYSQVVATIYTERLQRAVEEAPLLPEPWRQASTLSDWSPRLTPARAQALTERLVALLEEVVDDHGPDDSGEPAPFAVQLQTFPQPGRVGGDPG